MSRITACTLAVLACAAAAPSAHAGPSSPTTAIVALGDSYISGEAGRWEGNSNAQFASRDARLPRRHRRQRLPSLRRGGDPLQRDACATDWTTSSADDPEYCYDDQQPQVDARMPGAMAAVGHAVDEVRAVMADAGYAQSDYRFVLQSYPSPVPRGPEDRYFHPNAYAQRGIGRCLTLLWSSAPGRYACRNTPGQSYDAMTLAPS